MHGVVGGGGRHARGQGARARGGEGDGLRVRDHGGREQVGGGSSKGAIYQPPRPGSARTPSTATATSFSPELARAGSSPTQPQSVRPTRGRVRTSSVPGAVPSLPCGPAPSLLLVAPSLRPSFPLPLRPLLPPTRAATPLPHGACASEGPSLTFPGSVPASAPVHIFRIRTGINLTQSPTPTKCLPPAALPCPTYRAPASVQRPPRPSVRTNERRACPTNQLRRHRHWRHNCLAYPMCISDCCIGHPAESSASVVTLCTRPHADADPLAQRTRPRLNPAPPTSPAARPLACVCTHVPPTLACICRMRDGSASAHTIPMPTSTPLCVYPLPFPPIPPIHPTHTHTHTHTHCAARDPVRRVRLYLIPPPADPDARFDFAPRRRGAFKHNGLHAPIQRPTIQYYLTHRANIAPISSRDKQE